MCQALLPWLSATIHHKPKLARIFPDSVRIQGPFKIQLWLLVFSLSCQERHTKEWKMFNLLGFIVACSSPQASPKVEASDRSKQAQSLSTCRKVDMDNQSVEVRTQIYSGVFRSWATNNIL